MSAGGGGGGGGGCCPKRVLQSLMGGSDKFYRDTRDTTKVIPLPTPPSIPQSINSG